MIETSQEAYNISSQKISLIDSELTELRNSIDLTTNRKTSEIIDNANIVAKKIKTDTEDIIKLESLRLKLEVESIILELSLEIAKLEIRKEINDEKDIQLISSFLSEVKQNAISNS